MKQFLSYCSLLLILFIFTGLHAAAQDEATTRFIDSLKKTPLLHDTAAIKVREETDSAAEEETANASTEEMLVDTAVAANPRPIGRNTIALIKKDKGFYYQLWLDSLLRAEKEPPKPLNIHLLGLFFTIFQIVLWVLAGAVLVFVLYKLFLGKSALFVRTRKNIEAVITIEEDEAAAGQYEGLIKKAEAENNYRLAVRYLHLQALYNLSEKGHLRLSAEKTNFQYTGELSKRVPAIALLFAELTYKYEYIWYGEYAVNGARYNSLKRGFTELNNAII